LGISVDFALEMHKISGLYLPQIWVQHPGSLGQSGDHLRKGLYGQSRIWQTVGTLLNKQMRIEKTTQMCIKSPNQVTRSYPLGEGTHFSDIVICAIQGGEVK
jgi:hypothetical protein